ncbi:MAG: hypothetical protein JW896_09520 [Deltaproteobacteria bacterium]|nr:hypothetical protein [Deltaproteobacteria bacterium]
MKEVLSHKKSHDRTPTSWLRGFLVFLSVALIVSMFSCRKEEKRGPRGEEKETGIHETVDRGPATLFLDIDRKEITVAERINLKITMVIDEDYEVRLPGFGEKLEQFGIVDYHTTQPELTEDNHKEMSRSYVLEPFLSGEYLIPPMEVTFWKTGEEETEAHKIQTPEVTIAVKSILPEDLEEVKLNEIKPPVPFPRSFSLWTWAGIGSALVVAVTAVAVVLIRRRKRMEEVWSQRVPAHELAYEELRRLVAEDLVKKGEVKVFYQRLSGIVRHYIENRFGLRAPEQTTEEFLTSLETEQKFPGTYRPLLKTFLTHCDLVKFAEHQPGAEDIQKTFDSCKAFIKGTEEEE